MWRKVQRSARKEIQARFDSERARRLGLSPRDMSDVFSFTLGGMRLARFNAGEREVEMNLSLALADRENLDDLRQLVVATRDGRPVALSEVADFQVVPRAQEIERENRKIKATVRAAFEGKEFGPTREKIAAAMDGIGLPTGMTWSFNQRIEEGFQFLAMASELKYLVSGLSDDLAQANWTRSERTTTESLEVGSAVRY